MEHSDGVKQDGAVKGLQRSRGAGAQGGRAAGRVREGRYVKFDAGMDELLQYSSTGVDNRETIQNLGRAS